MEIIIPALILGLLGLFFGITLAIASKKMAVAIDPRLDALHGLLPGSNCGTCGGAGCFGFAESVLSGKLNIEACRVSSDETREKIAKLLGKNLAQKVKQVAVLHCNGGSRVKDRFIYQGIEDCVAANLLLGGQKACTWGCLGFATCVKVCPFGAITMSEKNLPVVNKDKCTACNKCVLACPKKLFELAPVNQEIYVACSSHDSPKDTRAVCRVGCIACSICAKVSDSAFYIKDNLSCIDYHKAGKQQPFAEARAKCPTKCIVEAKEVFER